MGSIRSVVAAGVLSFLAPVANAATLDISSVDGTGQFAGTPTSVGASTSVLIGTLTYERIRGSGTFQKDFDVTLEGTADGQAFSVTQAFDFAKSAACGNANCPNLFSIIPMLATPLVITQGTTVFTLFVDGFVEAVGGHIMTDFRSVVNSPRPLFLQASITIDTVPVPVPVPAGGLLLAGALGSLAWMRRRKA
jgi:hypothetical protein